MRARCRDEIRNNPYAASACDNFEAQAVGDGIWPQWNLPKDPALKKEIESAFFRWARRVNLYGFEATAAREIFESGEIFCRFHVRPSSWGLRIPLDLQLIEGEQIPIFLNNLTGGSGGVPQGNSIRTGIEFDPYERRVAYHMYRHHPGEASLFPMDGMTFIRVPATEILHVYKPLRAGLLRGVPHLSVALTMLHEIAKYSDAAVVKKQIQTMFCAFIKKVSPEGDVMPAPNQDTSQLIPLVQPTADIGVREAVLETGTVQELLPGEEVQFPTLPQDSDIETFFSVFLHQFAVSIGSTYEQITGDLRGVNLSSIRYGIQCAQRKTTQFQRNILISTLLHPIAVRWLKEAVLSGELTLPFYARDPERYEDLTWRIPGWPYMDPLVDAQAATLRIRAGLSSRSKEAADIGEDSTQIDAQQVLDNTRADKEGLIHDSDGRKVLPKGTKLTKDGEDDAGGVAGVKPKDTVIAEPTAPASGKPNGKSN